VKFWLGLIIILFTFVLNAEERFIVTFDDAKKLLMSNNRDVLSALEKVKAAEGKLTEASSAFFPKLNLIGSYNYMTPVPKIDFSIPQSQFNSISKSIETGANNNWLFKATFTQTIFDWGRSFDNYDAASLSYDISKIELEIVKVNTLSNLVQSFYGIILAKEVLNVSERSLEIAKEHLSVAEQKLKEGAGSSYEVLRSKVHVSTLKPIVSKAKNSVEISKNFLKNILNISLDKDIEINGKLEEEYIDIPSFEEVLKEAKENRLELKKLQKTKEMSEKMLNVISSYDKPSVTGVVSYSYQNPYFSQISWADSWNAGLVLNIPLFDGFQTAGKLKQAQTEVSSVDLNIKNMESLIELEVRQAILNLNEIKERVISQKDAVVEAEEYERIAEVSFKSGVITNLEVMDAQLSLLNTKVNYFQALYDYLIAKSNYLKAIGELK
jgi:outer membrane protein TolC